MLTALDAKGYRTHVRFGLFDCNSDGDDILIDELGLKNDDYTPFSSIINHQSTISCLRQQKEPYLCLADFIRPVNAEGIRDRIGLFAACADEAIEHSFEGEDDYRHLLCQTLADRLAEATIECAHEAIRKTYWGYAPDEKLPIAELHAGHFRGIRPAVGYPCLPDQSLNFDLNRLLDFSAIGIRLTEHGAMQPHASISGLLLSHPKARYFAVGRIDETQLNDYAKRKGRTPEAMRPYLIGNLI